MSKQDCDQEKQQISSKNNIDTKSLAFVKTKNTLDKYYNSILLDLNLQREIMTKINDQAAKKLALATIVSHELYEEVVLGGDQISINLDHVEGFNNCVLYCSNKQQLDDSYNPFSFEKQSSAPESSVYPAAKVFIEQKTPNRSWFF